MLLNNKYIVFLPFYKLTIQIFSRQGRLRRELNVNNSTCWPSVEWLHKHKLVSPPGECEGDYAHAQSGATEQGKLDI